MQKPKASAVAADLGGPQKVNGPRMAGRVRAVAVNVMSWLPVWRPVPAYIAYLPSVEPEPAATQRMALLSATRDVLVVGARVPAAVLRRALEAAGADLEHVTILDVTGTPAPPDKERGHITVVAGPHLLESIAARANKIAKSAKARPVTVVVDDVATFSIYAPDRALLEIAHRAVALLTGENRQEYLVPPGFIDEPILSDLRPMLDGVLAVDASGEAQAVRDD